MLIVKAIAPRDGWAFVQDGDSLLLLRPPYQKRVPVTSGELARCLAVDGYVPTSDEFESWAAVEAHLRDMMVDTATADERQRARDVGQRFLKRATSSEIERHLGRVETQLIARGAWDEACRFLVLVLGLEQLDLEPRLRVKVANLLAQVNEQRAGPVPHETAPVEVAGWFNSPDIGDRRALAEKIRDRHQVLAVGQ